MITPEQKQQLLDFVNSLQVEEVKPIKTRISEIGDNEVIHTKTEAEYYRISILLYLQGKKWRSGKSYLEEIHYDLYIDETCFEPSRNTYQGLNYHKDRGYTIIPSFQITGV